MIHNLRCVERSAVDKYDIVIVGTGPAGIVLANELIMRRPEIRICMLESGLEKYNEFADSLKKVSWDLMRVKSTSRERIIGGASTTWCGLSAPFDDFEMKQRNYIDSPGWPINRSELDKYYQEASERYRFPPLKIFNPDASNEWKKLRENGDLHPNWNNIAEKHFFAATNPQRFAEEFIHLFENRNIDLYLGASVKKFDWCSENGNATVMSAVVRDYDNREMFFYAECYVLCAGGIENSRILLNSTNESTEALGNHHDQVGRYFMNHPKCYECIIDLFDSVRYLPYFFGAMWNGFSGYAGFQLRDEIQLNKKLMNAYIRFEPLFPWSDNPGVDSLIYLVKKTKFLFIYWKKINAKKVVELRSYAETGDETHIDEIRPSIFTLCLNILRNFSCVVHYSLYRLFKQPVIKQVRLCSFMEMEPVKENRVTLGVERDAHGFQLPHVTYMLTERDKISLIELTKILAEELEKKKIGRLNYGNVEDANFFNIISKDRGVDASHHMGGTRMGVSPKESVVDSFQKVHDVKGLYVNGSSVFPTSGVANPTYTIVALSIRLAEHLSQDVFSHSQKGSSL